MLWKFIDDDNNDNNDNVDFFNIIITVAKEGTYCLCMFVSRTALNVVDEYWLICLSSWRKTIRCHHHHHHHHHPSILDAGHDPLCPDHCIRDGAVLCSRTSQVHCSRTCLVLLQMFVHWVTLSLLQVMNSRVLFPVLTAVY